MPMSDYLRHLRERVGKDLVLMPSAAVAVLDARQRLLLVRDRAMDLWCVPGGAVDPDETPADAAVRELWEETGLLVEPCGVLGVYGGPDFRITYPNGDVVSYCTIAFRAQIVAGEPQPDGDEVAELGWFSAAEAAALATGPWTRAMMQDAFASRAEARFAIPTWQPPSSGRPGA
jgi:8-oxo-dGTP pyrophosphatase MutT (NUDIX family)